MLQLSAHPQSDCSRPISFTRSGCPGSSRPPVTGSTTSVTLRPKPSTRSSTAAGQNDSANTAPSTPPLSAADITELLRHRRCCVLKRVPKARRISAAEKLAVTLRQVMADPDNVDKWVALLSFSTHVSECKCSAEESIIVPLSCRKSMQPQLGSRLFLRESSSRNRSSLVLTTWRGEWPACSLSDGDVHSIIRLAASTEQSIHWSDNTSAAESDIATDLAGSALGQVPLAQSVRCTTSSQATRVRFPVS